MKKVLVCVLVLVLVAISFAGCVEEEKEGEEEYEFTIKAYSIHMKTFVDGEIDDTYVILPTIIMRNESILKINNNTIRNKDIYNVKMEWTEFGPGINME